MYDVIVIGARCAGSPVGMLLARKGYRVLMVDRASFPSDTLSTHQVQIKGGSALKRWGLFDTVLATNCPPAVQASFHLPELSFQGKYPALGGVDAVISPRRTLLDKILVDAAIAAGVELRQDFLVDELVVEEGEVRGIRGHMKTSGTNGRNLEESARLVVGADGKHSLVAKSIQALMYDENPVMTCAYYTYWADLEPTDGALYNYPDFVAGFWPTNDSLSIIFTGYPASEFASIRGDIEGRFWQTMDKLGQAERLHAGRQAERFYGSVDLPNFYRRPYGPGWALVGDAGMCMDPITGQGIGNAFVDAERLAEAIDQALSGSVAYEDAMARYEKARNLDTKAMYEFTAQIGAFPTPPIEQQVLFSALANNAEHAERFFGALTGSVSMREFFSLPSILRMIGPLGVGRVLLGKLIPAHQGANAVG